MPHRSLQDAIIRLLKRRPFYGHFLLNFRKEQVVSEYPLGVTFKGGVPTLIVEPERFAALLPGEGEALLEHALKHVLHLHMARRGGRNAHLWDLCCDLAVNPGIASLPVDARLPGMYGLEDGLAAEEYYDVLAQRFDTGNLDGRGLGDAAQDDGQGTGEGDDPDLFSGAEPVTCDDHKVWQEAESTPAALVEEMVRSMVADAWKKSDGDLPSELRQVVEGYLSPSPIPWRQVLRQFVGTAGRIGKRTTWTREHRRFSHETPGVRKKRMLNLLVGIDVSESTDRPELREAFARELMRISRGREARITVLYANSLIRRIESFSGPAVRVESFHGGGFTDLRPVFDYAKKMMPPPAAVIYLTDGQGPAPERMEFPTLWVLTEDGEKPVSWGAELRLVG